MKVAKIALMFFSLTILVPVMPSCKSIAKTAAKHWTRKQKKKFVEKCKEGTINKLGEKGNDICKCVAQIAEEKYPDADDAMEMKVVEIVKMAMECK